MANTNIVAAGKIFDVGSRVVLWDEETGLSFYKRAMKYAGRDDSFDELSTKMNCFVIHHAASWTAKTTYNGLVGRGLSCNFIIDDDDVNGVATIYQCLDIKDAGYSHKPLNMAGPGVEIAYQPTAWSMPNAYSPLNVQKMGLQPHTTVDDTVHGVKKRVYAPTDAQINACINLIWGFLELFPAVESSFPRDAQGNISKTTVKNPKGLLAHFHITGEKVDPYGFPFDMVEKEVKAKSTWGY